MKIEKKQLQKENVKWLSDVQKIKEKLEEKEKEEKNLNKKEIIREAVLEKTRTILKENEKQFLKREKEELKQDDKLKKEVLKKAIELTKKEGILEGIKFTVKKKNPWLIDAFHDKIIEEIEKAINI